MVSSLPLLTKPDDQRVALLEDAFSLMAPGGTFVQFTYGMNSPIPRRAALDYEADVSAPVWLNLPPARVWIYRRCGEGVESKPTAALVSSLALPSSLALASSPEAASREPVTSRLRGGETSGFRPARDHRGSLFHRVTARAKKQRHQ